jgi:hypothetical protein
MPEKDKEQESGFRIIKILVLSFLTVLVAIPIFSALAGSLNEPQVTNQLQLYQTDLQLQASAWRGNEDLEPEDVESLRETLLGENPLEAAAQQYRTVRQEAQTVLARSQTQLEAAQSPPETVEENLEDTVTPSSRQVLRATQQQQSLVNQIDLRLGVLEAEQGEEQQAIATWSEVEPPPATENQSAPTEAAETAQVLVGLWRDPPQIAQDAEMVIQQNLNGWFRYRALEQLYQVQQRPEALEDLLAAEQAAAEGTFIKLGLIGVLPVLGSLTGVGLAIALGVQWFLKGKQSVLAQHGGEGWMTPWSWEIIWQVLIVGFFFVGQFVLPILLSLAGIQGGQFSGRERAVYSLAYYLLMSAGGLLVLYWSIRSYLPLPQDWFKIRLWDKWPLWGLGGYLVALPLMIGVSLINQQIWNGQGGSNPLLQTVLEEGDMVALVVFFATAAIAAPLFEETLFRGFLLPSLTRYMPVGGAILLSSFIFAAAHLSLSEVLPLMTLGIILGFIYSRSRNLLAPILLHSLWNSATMISLFILGSSAR